MSDAENSPETVTCQLIIHGKVQGVYYRVSAQNEALKLKLHGWVRNLPSGEVEALVSGPADLVDAFIDWARQGPPAARVDRIEIAAADAPEPGLFSLHPTP